MVDLPIDLALTSADVAKFVLLWCSRPQAAGLPRRPRPVRDLPPKAHGRIERGFAIHHRKAAAPAPRGWATAGCCRRSEIRQ